MKHLLKLNFLFALICGIFLAGCNFDPFNFGNNNDDLGPAGVWKSENLGGEWKESGSLLVAEGPARSIMGTGLYDLVPDPSDSRAWYAPAGDNGLFFTIDGGRGWQGSLGGSGRVLTIAIDPSNKCTLYAGAGSRILKSIDCARTWSSIFQDPRPNAIVRKVMVDFRFPRTVYASLESGDLLRSVDAGLTWAPIFRFSQAITNFRIGPSSNRNLYVTTQGGGLWRSIDQGANWVSFLPIMEKTLQGSNQILDFYLNANENVIITASPNGLLRSDDAGQTWTMIRLITTPDQTQINNFFVDPSNPSRLFYAMNGTLYRSFDSGNSWSTRKLPSRRSVGAFRADRQNNEVLWIVFKPE